MGKSKYLVLVIAIVAFGLLLTGGTYAWLTFTSTVGNNTYNGTSTCFLVDYDYTNDDNTTNITGTLMQTSIPLTGLSGKFSMAINTGCNVTSTGIVYLKVNSGTSSTLYSKVGAHCERSSTLETMKSYTTSSACTSAGHKWVTNGTALKYAIYEVNTTGTPVAVGYVSSASDLTVYNNFALSTTAKTYYLYIWLDGELATNSYAGLKFDGYVHLGATQVE